MTDGVLHNSLILLDKCIHTLLNFQQNSMVHLKGVAYVWLYMPVTTFGLSLVPLHYSCWKPLLLHSDFFLNAKCIQEYCRGDNKQES